MALIGWWQFENNYNDSSMYEWSCSLNSGSLSYDSGPIGKSIRIDSTPVKIGAYIPKVLYKTSALSISMFLYIRTLDSDIIITGTFYDGTNGIFLYAQASPAVLFWTNYYIQPHTGSIGKSQIPTYYTPNKWFHLCCTRDATTGTTSIYIDGKLVNKDILTTFKSWYDDASSTDFGVIGPSLNSYLPKNIMVSDYKLFNHELSVKEIEELSKGKIFHVDFEETCDNIAGRIATASIVSNTGYLHNSGSAYSSDTSRVGETVFEANAQVNSLTYGNPSILQYDLSASGHTFAFWLNEKNYSSPSGQNIFYKSYAGAGCMNVESGG